MKCYLEKHIGTVEDIRAEEDTVFLQKSTSQEAVYDKSKIFNLRLIRRDDGYYIRW